MDNRRSFMDPANIPPLFLLEPETPLLLLSPLSQSLFR